jgi:hypothetical protein
MKFGIGLENQRNANKKTSMVQQQSATPMQS